MGGLGAHWLNEVILFRQGQLDIFLNVCTILPMVFAQLCIQDGIVQPVEENNRWPWPSDEPREAALDQLEAASP